MVTGNKKRRFAIEAGRILVWMIIWELISLAVGDTVPFAGPAETFLVLWRSFSDRDFYTAVFTTFLGISMGFFAAMLTGTLLGYLACVQKSVDFLLTPVIDFWRYIPMITFTLLAILWSDSSVLAFEVSLFLSVPVIYKHTLTGLKNSSIRRYMKDDNRRHVPLRLRLRMYQPVSMPEYISGCHRALNMCWKSGIIAQLIGNTRHSIGSILYTATDNEDVASVFAMTIVIVALSIFFEQVVIRFLSMDCFNADHVRLNNVFEGLEDEEISL